MGRRGHKGDRTMTLSFEFGNIYCKYHEIIELMINFCKKIIKELNVFNFLITLTGNWIWV